MSEQTQKTDKKRGELGVSGLSIDGGRFYDDVLWELAGARKNRIYREMLANDPIIGALMNVIEMMAKQTEWKILPWDETENEFVEDADFIRGCLKEDMTQTWAEVLSDILTFVPWGWSYLEICYKERGGDSKDKRRNSRYTDGRIGWRKWAIRAQESLDRWDLDEFNEVEAMVQMAPTDYKERVIPIEKALHFRSSANRGHAEGKALLRNLYRPWYFKTNLENIRAIGIERDLAGYPFARVPTALLSNDASPSEIQLRNYISELVSEIRRDESEGALFPLEYDDQGNELYKFELLSAGSERQFNISEVVEYYDQRMLMSAIADFILLGTTKNGNYALSKDKTEMFTTALSSYLDSICDEINRFAIPDLMRLNGLRTDKTPYLVHGEIEKIPLEDICKLVDTISKAGGAFDEEQFNFLKRKGGIPVKDN